MRVEVSRHQPRAPRVFSTIAFVSPLRSCHLINHIQRGATTDSGIPEAQQPDNVNHLSSVISSLSRKELGLSSLDFDPSARPTPKYSARSCRWGGLMWQMGEIVRAGRSSDRTLLALLRSEHWGQHPTYGNMQPHRPSLTCMAMRSNRFGPTSFIFAMTTEWPMTDPKDFYPIHFPVVGDFDGKLR